MNLQVVRKIIITIAIISLLIGLYNLLFVGKEYKGIYGFVVTLSVLICIIILNIIERRIKQIKDH